MYSWTKYSTVNNRLWNDFTYVTPVQRKIYKENSWSDKLSNLRVLGCQSCQVLVDEGTKWNTLFVQVQIYPYPRTCIIHFFYVILCTDFSNLKSIRIIINEMLPVSSQTNNLFSDRILTIYNSLTTNSPVQYVLALIFALFKWNKTCLCNMLL